MDLEKAYQAAMYADRITELRGLKSTVGDLRVINIEVYEGKTVRLYTQELKEAILAAVEAEIEEVERKIKEL